FLHLAASSRRRKPIRHGQCTLLLDSVPEMRPTFAARFVARWLLDRLSQQFIVENRPSALRTKGSTTRLTWGMPRRRTLTAEYLFNERDRKTCSHHWRWHRRGHKTPCHFISGTSVACVVSGG